MDARQETLYQTYCEICKQHKTHLNQQKKLCYPVVYVNKNFDNIFSTRTSCCCRFYYNTGPTDFSIEPAAFNYAFLTIFNWNTLIDRSN